MQKVTILCTGKLKEKFYLDAVAEYVKRLNRFCKLEIIELPEERLPEDRSDVLVVAYWHERWGAYMGWCAPERAAWSVHVGIGDRSDIAVTHWMPLPEPPEEER